MARIPDDVRTAIVDAVRADRTFAAIAQEFGVSKSSVQRVASAAGVPAGERAQTKNATRTRAADMAARRSQLADDALRTAAHILARVTQPARYREKYTDAYEGGGSTTRYEWLDVDEPLPVDQQRLAVAFAVHLDKHLVLIDRDASPELVAARSLLETAGRALVSSFGSGDDQVTDD